MCTGAIARSGLGRVVFALSGEQLQQLQREASGAVSPDTAEVAYEGPALFAEARLPIEGYSTEPSVDDVLLPRAIQTAAPKLAPRRADRPCVAALRRRPGRRSARAP